MATKIKQYCFKYKVTNEESKFDDFFASHYGNYGDAMDELTDHIINILGTGFEFIELKIIIRYG